MHQPYQEQTASHPLREHQVLSAPQALLSYVLQLPCHPLQVPFQSPQEHIWISPALLQYRFPLPFQRLPAFCP